MRSAWTRILVVLMAIAWAPGAVARGQEEQGKQGFPDYIDLVFKGGTAADYANAVRRVSNEQIVVMPGCDHYRMPAVELHGVFPIDALTPLQFAEPIDPDNPIRLVVSGVQPCVVAPQKPLQQASPPRELQAFSVAEVLESGQFKAEDVLTAVQTALDMGNEGHPEVKYHPETRLLIVRGTPDALDAVRNVLSGVMQSASAMKSGARDHAQDREQIAALEAQLHAADQQIEEAQKYADQVQEMVKQGEAGPLDLLKGRQRVIDAQQQRMEFAGQLQILQEREERKAAMEKAETEFREQTGQGNSNPKER